MMVILLKLEECGGLLAPRHNSMTGKRSGAYEIIGYRVGTWFPEWAVDGIIERGLVDSDGRLNDAGRAAIGIKDD